MRTLNSAKNGIQTGKTEFARLYQNPNTRYAIIGIISAFVILGVTLFGLRAVGSEESVMAFVKRWEQAIESKQPSMYQMLWDSSARRQNKEQYERAVKLILKEKIEADVTGIAPRKDFKQTNRYRIEHIPVTLFQDGEVLMTLYRDLTVEKKGVWGHWKLINDEIRDELESPEVTEEHTNQDSTVLSSPDAAASTSTADNINPDGTPQTAAPDEPSSIGGTAPIDAKLKLSQILGEWQTAWQDKDLETYMSKYAEEADITRVAIKGGRESQQKLTKPELRERMEALNEKYSKIEVAISNVQINGDNAVVDVDFLQEFVGTPASGNQPAYSDYGAKTLIFMVDPADGLWKIYSESWRMYENVPKYPKL